jgi:hypothetical protein
MIILARLRDLKTIVVGKLIAASILLALTMGILVFVLIV